MHGHPPPKGGKKSITDPNASVSFLKALFEFTEGPINLCVLLNSDLGNKAGAQATSRDPTPLEEFITCNDIPKWGNYLCVSTMKNNKLHHHKDSIAETPSLHADIDLKDIIDGIGPEDKDEVRRQRLKDDIIRKLMRLKHPPSLIVDSGNGIHAYWKFKEAFVYSEDKDTRAEQIDRIEDALKLLCDLVGGDFKVTQPSAVMRLPGSHNSKFGNWRKVVVVEQNGKRHELDDLEEWLGESSPIILRKDKPPARTAGQSNIWKEFADRHKPPIDVEQRLADMMYMGTGDSAVHTTQVSVSASLLSSGVDIEEVVEMLMAATQAAAGDYWQRWNKKREERNIRNMCETWLKKHPEILEDNSAQPADVTGDEWFDPWEEFHVPTFPKGILPAKLESYAAALAENMGTNVGEVSMAILAAISGAITHQTVLKMKKHGDWLALPHLWLLFAGDASTKKTPIFRTVLKPFEMIEAELAKQHLQQKIAWEKLSKEQQKEIDPPELPPRYMVYDSTPEKLGEIIAANPKGLIVKRDEFSGWIADQERYGNSSSRAFYLQGFDGGPYRMERVTRKGTDYIPNHSISMIGGIQPRKLSEIKGLTSDGLLQRFIVVMLQTQKFNQDCPIPSGFEGYIRSVIANPLHHGVVHTLSDAAYDVMRAIHKRLFDIEQSGTGIAEGFTEHVGKLPGYAGSLALLLHYAEFWNDKLPSMISADIVERVSPLIFEFLLPHALEFYRSYARDSSSGEVMQKVASWILTSKRERFTASDLASNVANFKGLGLFDINRRISSMVAAGWIKPNSKGPDNRTWTVNPKIHIEFAARAVEEERRKQELAKLMKSPRRGAGEKP